MIYNTEIAAKVAESLLQIKAIKLNNNKPFTWASGLKSPIYCDNRITLSYPDIRTYICQKIVELIEDKFGKVDVIAGVATAGIPQAALVAAAMGLPLIYVRSSEKKHGMTNKIEGVIKPGQSVVVIEDLISTGKSSLNAVDAIRDAGANVKGMVAIFTYGLKKASDNFENANCKLVTLSDYENLVKLATENNYISDNDLGPLMEWRKDPQAWSDGKN